MSDALPSHRYRDPAEVAAGDEIVRLRRERGCAVCTRRGRELLPGLHECAAGHQRQAGRAYCHLWILDETPPCATTSAS